MPIVEALTPISSTAGLFDRPLDTKDLPEQLADYVTSRDIIRDRNEDLPPALNAYGFGAARGTAIGTLLGAPKAYISSQHPEGSISPLGAMAISAGLGAIGGTASTAVKRYLNAQHLHDARSVIHRTPPSLKLLASQVQQPAEEYANSRKDDWLGAELGGVTGGLAGAIAGGVVGKSPTDTFVYGSTAGLAGATLGYLIGRARTQSKRQQLLTGIVRKLHE